MSEQPSPEPVSLPSRDGICVTCDGRIHHYPPPLSDDMPPPGSRWAHIDPADWVDHPHPAEPKADA